MVIAIKSANTNKYLRVVEKNRAQTYSLLQLVERNENHSPDIFSQFEVVNSTIHSGRFHLRCRYNNKYLIRWSPKNNCISASANRPNENQSDWSCTLFKRINNFDGNVTNNNFGLLHVQLGCYVRVGKPDFPPNIDSCAFVHSKEIDSKAGDVFTFVNLNQELTFSKRVAFRGDDGSYITGDERRGKKHIVFVESNNINDPKFSHEMYTTPEGLVYIKSNHFGQFWRYGYDDWILGDADDPRGSDNVEAMFRITPIDSKKIAIQNMSKIRYVKRFHDASPVQVGLRADIEDADYYTPLEVIDLGSESYST